MKKLSKVFNVLGLFVYFVAIFGGVFFGLWYFKTYRAVKFVHIMSPSVHSFDEYPHFAKFYNQYQKKFDMVVRNESKPSRH